VGKWKGLLPATVFAVERPPSGPRKQQTPLSSQHLLALFPRAPKAAAFVFLAGRLPICTAPPIRQAAAAQTNRKLARTLPTAN